MDTTPPIIKHKPKHYPGNTLLKGNKYNLLMTCIFSEAANCPVELAMHFEWMWPFFRYKFRHFFETKPGLVLVISKRSLGCGIWGCRRLCSIGEIFFFFLPLTGIFFQRKVNNSSEKFHAKLRKKYSKQFLCDSIKDIAFKIWWNFETQHGA